MHSNCSVPSAVTRQQNLVLGFSDPTAKLQLWPSSTFSQSSFSLTPFTTSSLEFFCRPVWHHLDLSFPLSPAAASSLNELSSLPPTCDSFPKLSPPLCSVLNLFYPRKTLQTPESTVVTSVQETAWSPSVTRPSCPHPLWLAASNCLQHNNIQIKKV